MRSLHKLEIVPEHEECGPIRAVYQGTLAKLVRTVGDPRAVDLD